MLSGCVAPVTSVANEQVTLYCQNFGDLQIYVRHLALTRSMQSGQAA